MTKHPSLPKNLEFEIESWVRSKLTPARYRHSLGVLETVVRLAQVHHVEEQTLRLAALLHDCARELPPQEMLRIAEEWQLPLRPADRQNPILLHGRLGVAMAQRELGFAHPQVSSAIIAHTAGHPRMNLADKVLFLADQIEPDRIYPRVAELRSLAFADIHQAMALAVEINCRFLETIGAVIDPDTLSLKQALEQAES